MLLYIFYFIVSRIFLLKPYIFLNILDCISEIMCTKLCINITNQIMNYRKSSLCLGKQLLLCNNRAPNSFNFHKKISLYQVQKTKISKDLDTSKAKLIKNLNFKCHEDALPFYKLSMKTLLHIVTITKRDVENGYCENRLYYVASHIKVPSNILSKHIVNRVFIYTLSFNWIEKSLNVLLAMDVSGDRILRDLWVLKYHHKTIEERLQRIKNLGVVNLYPWMVRCSEDILNRYIEIFQDTKSILGENKSTKMYLADRLNVSPDSIEDMYIKAPALKTIRVTKVKKFLDFLISEGFSHEEIAGKSRILAASQNTVEKRLDKLRKLGICEINLNVLCRSRKDFKKYCESIESSSKESM